MWLHVTNRYRCTRYILSSVYQIKIHHSGTMMILTVLSFSFSFFKLRFRNINRKIDLSWTFGKTSLISGCAGLSCRGASSYTLPLHSVPFDLSVNISFGSSTHNGAFPTGQSQNYLLHFVTSKRWTVAKRFYPATSKRTHHMRPDLIILCVIKEQMAKLYISVNSQSVSIFCSITRT